MNSPHDLVSIHAQPSLAGRRTGKNLFYESVMFQSTPSRVWLGDAVVVPALDDAGVSIHAQPSLAGRRGLLRANPRVDLVSIHAQPSLAGRQRAELAARGLDSFQSTPSRVWLGDHENLLLTCSETGFNPRPAEFGWATSSVLLIDQLDIVSIHAQPSLAGRPGRSSRCDRARRFQSTPSRVWLGDTSAAPARRLCACFNPRPAEFGWATRLHPRRGPQTRCFNPRPAEFGWATEAEHVFDLLPSGFNPRPAEFGWATALAETHADLMEVSIHAQPSLAGRQRLSVLDRWRHEFQSTPSRVWLGDLRSSQLHEFVTCFNPRPAEFGWATSSVS